MLGTAVDVKLEPDFNSLDRWALISIKGCLESLVG